MSEKLPTCHGFLGSPDIHVDGFGSDLSRSPSSTGVIGAEIAA